MLVTLSYVERKRVRFSRASARFSKAAKDPVNSYPDRERVHFIKSCSAENHAAILGCTCTPDFPSTSLHTVDVKLYSLVSGWTITKRTMPDTFRVDRTAHEKQTIHSVLLGLILYTLHDRTIASPTTNMGSEARAERKSTRPSLL
jgi:hypothetical protein